MSSEPIGTLAEEAARLIAVVQGWTAEHVDPADRAGADGDPVARDRSASDHASHDPAAECRWCPLCQLARFARGTSPEVRDHLSNAATSLVLAFRGLMDSVETPPDRYDPVEKIDLDSPED